MTIILVFIIVIIIIIIIISSSSGIYRGRFGTSQQTTGPVSSAVS